MYLTGLFIFLLQDSVGAVGLPVSVQVVAPPCHEEVCLRVMKEIQQGIGQAYKE